LYQWHGITAEFGNVKAMRPAAAAVYHSYPLAIVELLAPAAGTDAPGRASFSHAAPRRDMETPTFLDRSPAP
jgi:hypothetical protein